MGSKGAPQQPGPGGAKRQQQRESATSQRAATPRRHAAAHRPTSGRRRKAFTVAMATRGTAVPRYHGDSFFFKPFIIFFSFFFPFLFWSAFQQGTVPSHKVSYCWELSDKGNAQGLRANLFSQFQLSGASKERPQCRGFPPEPAVSCKEPLTFHQAIKTLTYCLSAIFPLIIES